MWSGLILGTKFRCQGITQKKEYNKQMLISAVLFSPQFSKQTPLQALLVSCQVAKVMLFIPRNQAV
jgi:hypothetical protein